MDEGSTNTPYTVVVGVSATSKSPAALAWADARLPGARTVCMIAPQNLASIRLAERVGYRPYAQARYRDEAVQLFERPRAA